MFNTITVQITEHLEYLNQTNALVSTSVAGTTLEGRDIVLVTISTEDAASSTKPVLFFDCNIHAREWIAGAVCLSLIDRVIEYFTEIFPLYRALARCSALLGA